MAALLLAPPSRPAAAAALAAVRRVPAAARPSAPLEAPLESRRPSPPSPLAATSAAAARSAGRGFASKASRGGGPPDGARWKAVDVPLVFVPGMKGSHLAFDDDGSGAAGAKRGRRKRAWLTLGNLLNLPPRPDSDPERDLSLPLTYDYRPAEGEDGAAFERRPPRQRRGPLVPDGIVDHIVEFHVGGSEATNLVDLNFLPFYGHATRMLRDLDRAYRATRRDGREESTESFSRQDDDDDDANTDGARGGSAPSGGGVFDRAGSFVERTSEWAFSSRTNETRGEQQSRHALRHCRPTAAFGYDWRRPLPELCAALHEFVEETFPDRPVQVVAHSLGGLMTFAAMKEHPEKYAPGAVVVGVPFETGIQYLQDLHKGYYTELDRCRQFTPEKQFSMSSHWGFFPITKDRLEDRFVDVTERCERGDAVKFEADKSGIGKKAEIQPRIEGDNAYFDFYDPDEWERLDLGVFGPEYDDVLSDDDRRAYKEHMRVQMAAAKEWRRTTLGEGDVDDERAFVGADSFPPLVACASYDVPTVNQILRRRREPSPSSPRGGVTRRGRSPANPWEYDYVSGRAVPGDGRIDYDKAFPPGFVEHRRVTLGSAHAKQMCWEESGGSWGRIYEEVVRQAEEYLQRQKEDERMLEAGSSGAREKGAMENGDGRGKSMMKRIAVGARNARKRIRRRGPVRPGGSSDSDLAVAVRRRRFSFRRR